MHSEHEVLKLILVISKLAGGGSPQWHILGDCLPLLNGDCDFELEDGSHGHIEGRWDLIIAHPPCTDLAVSGAKYFAKKIADGRQQRSVDFFMKFTDVNCDHVAIENPICIMSTKYRKPDQIIQPYWFGHPIRKSTCLWLKNLPKLVPTNEVSPSKSNKYGFTPEGAMWMARDENGKIISWNDPRTARIRSRTFHGIAEAIADQWGEYIKSCTE